MLISLYRSRVQAGIELVIRKDGSSLRVSFCYSSVGVVDPKVLGDQFRPLKPAM